MTIQVSAGDGREVSAIVCPSRYILAAGWSRVIRVYSDVPGHDDDGMGICAGCVDQWDQAHDEDIMCMALLRPTTVVTASYDGDLVVWSLDNGGMVARFNAEKSTGPLRSAHRLTRATGSPRRRRTMYVDLAVLLTSVGFVPSKHRDVLYQFVRPQKFALTEGILYKNKLFVLLKKWQLALHFHLRLPVPPVVLSVDHEAHIMHSAHQINTKMGQSLQQLSISDPSSSLGTFFRGLKLANRSHSCMAELYQISRGHRPLVVALKCLF